MNYDDMVAVITSEMRKQGLNPYSAARESGLPQNSFRYLIEGRKIHVPRLLEICDALGLEFYIGPPHAAPQSIEKKANPPSTSPALTPVKDRDLAELLALLADEWEALNPHGREQLATRFRAAFPELRGGAALSKVVGWLGWQVIESGSKKLHRNP